LGGCAGCAFVEGAGFVAVDEVGSEIGQAVGKFVAYNLKGGQGAVAVAITVSVGSFPAVPESIDE